MKQSRSKDCSAKLEEIKLSTFLAKLNNSLLVSVCVLGQGEHSNNQICMIFTNFPATFMMNSDSECPINQTYII